jgi:hypothetical protein
MTIPVGLSSECYHEQAQREPVAIASTWTQMFGSMFKVPSDVFDLPLVWSQLPALKNQFGDSFGTTEMGADGRSSGTRQTPAQ